MEKLKNNIWNDDDCQKNGQLRINRIFRPKKKIGGLDVVQQQSEVTNTESEANFRVKFIKQEFGSTASSSSAINSDLAPEKNYIKQETKSLESEANFRVKFIKTEFRSTESSSSTINSDRSFVATEKKDIKQETKQVSLVDWKKLARLKFNLWLPKDCVKDPALRLNEKLFRPKNRISELFLLQQSKVAPTAPKRFLKCKIEGERNSSLFEETIAVKNEHGEKRKHKSKKESGPPRVLKKKKTSAFVYGLDYLYMLCTMWEVPSDLCLEATSMYRYIKTTKKFTKVTFAAHTACGCLLIVLRKHYGGWSMRKLCKKLEFQRGQFNSAYKEARNKLKKQEQFKHYFQSDNVVNT